MQFTLTDLWAHMGWFARGIVLVLILMSIASVLVTCERIVVFVRAERASRIFADRIATLLAAKTLDHVASGDPADENCYLGRVITAGLKAYRMAGTHDHDLTVESVARALERQALREVQTLRRGQGMLATVGSVAPFVGLLGTVVGIVNAFRMMASSGSAGLGTVSGGIAEALVTTAIGLLVAVPAVVAYNFLQSWVEARAVDISESSNELVDHVARHLSPKRK
ncbi:MAG TPA: MotA/TolQ/ExbB proton channel family protein [Polyangiaceae bacterium]|nr:MotA/TolQ/ExbB proton channel family protein [Polyangiaceae bacterium]